MTVVLTTLL